jgi:serpin B
VRRASVDPAATAEASRAVAGFTADLYRRIAVGAAANLVCSPYSVAVALGMALQGARGRTAEQLLRVLHAPAATGAAAARLAAGLGGLDQALASRTRTWPDGEGKPVHVELAPANSLWAQRDAAWQQPFLDVLAADFGAGVRLVDYRTRTEDARTAINAWVSGQTHTRIPTLIPPGVLDTLTRLVLVNALYLKAPWQTPFDPTGTGRHPFTRPDGSTVTVDLMQDTLNACGYAAGTGWTAVDLPYAGGQLALAVILPDPGRFATVETSLNPTWLAGLMSGFRPATVQVGLPRWTTRTQTSLKDVLVGLGMPDAFDDAADFSGMTEQQRLQISAVLHEGFIAVDEKGTEAAAATAVAMAFMGAPTPNRRFIADRPFLFAIHDVPTGTPLFIGRVGDPTA